VQAKFVAEIIKGAGAATTTWLAVQLFALTFLLLCAGWKWGRGH
jgi:hypothetical protein